MEDRKVGRGSISLLLQTLVTGGFCEEPAGPEDADLVIANAFPSPPMLAKLRRGCTVNHFPGEQELGAKDRLARLLDGFDICPETFVLPADAARLRAAAVASEDGALWIAKPCQQGEGRHIHVLQNGDVTAATGPLSKRCVVSRYVAEPLLVQGRKADIRVYALVTDIEPELKAFLFRDGLVRFCGEAYDVSPDGVQRLSAHVSNNAVQTKTVRHACALNWTLPQLWEHLLAEGGPNPTVVWQRVHRLVRDALEAWRPAAVRAAARVADQPGAAGVRSYSLLAFDVLIDRLGQPWLLEVNPKPALHAQSASLKAVFPVHFQVKSTLLADLFSLLGLPRLAGGPVCKEDCESLGFDVLVPSALSPRIRFVVALMREKIACFLDDTNQARAAAACPRWTGLRPQRDARREAAAAA